MLNLIKKTWVDGETVNAQKMNTIRDDLETLNNGKVDAEAGKSLSTNDYTNEDKAKVTGAEQTSNKVTSLSSASTDTEYPSAKAVYDLGETKQSDIGLYRDIDGNLCEREV